MHLERAKQLGRRHRYLLVSPALPTGLSLSAGTGVTSGTATALSAAVDYTVTGTNSGGSDTAVINIAVNDVPPSQLVYSPSSLTCTSGAFCSLPAPSNSGGSTTASFTIGVNDVAPSQLVDSPAAFTCTVSAPCSSVALTRTGGASTASSVSPGLPVGLPIDGTGAVSGTPQFLLAAISYTVTASNGGGSTTASIGITVNDVAPSGLMYTPIHWPAR